MNELRRSALEARAEVEVIAEEWQARLAATTGSDEIDTRVSPDDPATLRLAVEAFDRLARVQAQAIEALDLSCRDGLRGFDAAKVDVERVASESASALDEAATRLLAGLDAAGSAWLARIEKAGRQAGSRRSRVRPPVVGMIVAVAIVFGAVIVAVAGDNPSSDAGSRRRPASPSTTTVPATTTTTTPASTTTVAAAESVEPTVTTPVTSPPAPSASPAIVEPPPLATSPPVLPSVPTPVFPQLPVGVCDFVPALCE